LKAPEHPCPRKERLVDRFLDAEYDSATTTALIPYPFADPRVFIAAADHSLNASIDGFVGLAIDSDSRKARRVANCCDAQGPGARAISCMSDGADDAFRPAWESILSEQGKVGMATLVQQPTRQLSTSREFAPSGFDGLADGQALFREELSCPIFNLPSRSADLCRKEAVE
jgi:hypothetical protein